MKGNAVRIISRQLAALFILTLAAATVFAQGNQVDLLILPVAPGFAAMLQSTMAVLSILVSI